MVSALGRTNDHLVDPDVKINGKYYRDVLLARELQPDIWQHSDYFILQQDGAPAHRANETVELLKTATPDVILPTLWPPNNPFDYKIFGTLQEWVYRTRIEDVDELRHRIADEWDKHKLEQNVIDKAVGQWRSTKTSGLYRCRWRRF